ncbi:MAG: SDR family NAD(P)-dependent oxidoreductase [Azospirillaceae bacterium]|nr:SDR family NAD(P)-dependent oxidoreductase [Azospirillaceae bacterium]
MNAKRLLVIGAAGDVGQGIATVAADSGWRVALAGRRAGALDALADRLGRDKATPFVGSVADATTAANLRNQVLADLGGLDAVVVAVNAPNVSRPLLSWQPQELLGVFDSNVLTHFAAAQAFIPCLGASGVFIGIGGGTADFVLPKAGQLSMAQAALRMMYRAIAKEAKEGPAVRELMIISMVNGPAKRAVADPAWVTDLDVGRHVQAIIQSPERFPGPILALKGRDQAGQPDVSLPEVRRA